MRAILVIARLTVQEASRRRLLLALVILTLLVVGFSGWGFNKITTVTRSDGTLLPAAQVTLISSQLLIVVTFMYSGVLALSAAVVAGPLISSEVESGLLLSMLARPMRRSEVVIGKWLGLAALVAIYAAGSAFLEIVAVDWATGYVPPHPIELVLFVGSEGLALLSLGLLLSTRLSGITGGVIALVAWLMAWIGGVVGDIGAGLQNEAVESVGTVSHLIPPPTACGAAPSTPWSRMWSWLRCVRPARSAAPIRSAPWTRRRFPTWAGSCCGSRSCSPSPSGASAPVNSKKFRVEL